jgi:hypothetical protein
VPVAFPLNPFQQKYPDLWVSRSGMTGKQANTRSSYIEQQQQL